MSAASRVLGKIYSVKVYDDFPDDDWYMIKEIFIPAKKIVVNIDNQRQINVFRRDTYNRDGTFVKDVMLPADLVDSFVKRVDSDQVLKDRIVEIRSLINE